MKEKFQDIKLSTSSMEVVDQCNEILEEYEAGGYDLSLRQLYYQLVARDLVENTEKSYKRIGGIVSDARLAGLIDWDMIKDRGRTTTEVSHWDSPADAISDAAGYYRIDLWEDQPIHVEVMVEKQALEGVLEPVCQRLDVPFTANKGYSSSSAMYEAGKRLESLADRGKDLVVLYLGDHDPSGIDMTRDVEERLALFSGGYPVEVVRVALNMDQIRKLNPPENPAKMSDSRAAAYVERFGESSWELDAIEPRALDQLVSSAVEQRRDPRIYNKARARQDKERETMRSIAAANKKPRD